MQLLLSTFGGTELTFTVIVLLVLASAVRSFLSNRNLKKQLDEVTKERDKLRDNLIA